MFHHSSPGKASPIPRIILVAGVLAASAAVLVATTSAGHAHGGKSKMTVKNGERCFSANGLPNHSTGRFPNSGNPNAIRQQHVHLCVTANPRRNSAPTPRRGPIGIATNGVQFRPGTAGYYDASSPRGHSRDPASGWKLEGLNPKNLLGMDASNAHVGPNGLYHYHGIPKGLVRKSKTRLIGYAADGFPIYNGAGTQRSSYRLKTGTRPSGPGGKYDGTFEQDFVYVAGSGTLDQCNGRTVNGKYRYYATKQYPFLPRCMWGTVSASFERATPHGREGGRFAARRDGARRGDGAQRRGPAARRRQGRRGPPRPAIRACNGKSDNTACSFHAPRRNRTISGSCLTTPHGIKACVPADRARRMKRRMQRRGPRG